jgi:hypothetical protein
MRSRRLLPAVLVAVLVGDVLTGCRHGPGGGATAGVTHESAPVAPAASAQEAAEALAAYVHGYNRAVTARDPAAAREPATGALAATSAADLRLARARRPRARAVSLANPVLYVPRSAAYPKWFVAAALERRGKTERPVLLTFAAEYAGAAWRPASRLYFTGDPPMIATDAQGYATALEPSARGLAMPPAELPAAQAGYLDRGDAQRLAPDAFGSRWLTTERRQEKALRATGVTVSGRSVPATYPLRTLRAADGGALVWFTVRRTATYRATGKAAAAKVPADVRAHLGRRTGRTIIATWLWQTVAHVPVRGRASVVVQAVDLVSAHAS